MFPAEKEVVSIAMLDYHLVNPNRSLEKQVATGIEIGIQGTKTVKPLPLRRRK